MNEALWRWVLSSGLVQALITLALCVAVTILAMMGKPIPDLLGQAFLLVLGFYFGTKVESAVVRSLLSGTKQK